MEETYIKLFRRFTTWGWFQKSEMVHLFIYLLIKAHRFPGYYQGIWLETGQLVTGRKTLSKATGISEQTIRTCLTRLEQTGEISIKSTNKYTTVTILNYSTYQSDSLETNQQLTKGQPTINQESTTIKESKNVRKKENKKESGRFVSPSLDEVKEYVRSRGNKIDPEHFYFHYEANGWTQGRNKLKSWKAAVITWEKNAGKFDGSRRKNPNAPGNGVVL